MSTADVFLYQGETSTSDVKLRDPTVVASGGNVTVALTGSASTAAAGTIVVALDVAATGDFATAAAGTLPASEDIALAGSSASAAAGTVTPAFTQALAGEVSTAQAGTIDIGVSVALLGAETASTAGSLTSDGGTLEVAEVGPQPAGRGSREVRRRRYIMPDGRVFIATTDEVLELLRLYAVPKESIEQLVVPPKPQTIRAPQITLTKRDVRFVPDEAPDTYQALISERFAYRAPADAYGHAEIIANRIFADEEALIALLM